MNFKTYSQLATDVRRSVCKVPKDVSLVVGNPRSGMIPAYMVGAFLNLPVCSLDEYLNNIKPSHGWRPLNHNKYKRKKILVVDDSVNLGNALRDVKCKLKKKREDAEYIFFAVYATHESKGLVDLFGDICDQPRVFQWNYLYHGILTESCFDIDGVLCIDPTSEQNDDGEKYVDFILNAEPLYIPNYKIKALVTSRLEKYRCYTEQWLEKHGVQYDQLYMLDLPSKEERIRLGAHGEFKSQVYKRLEDCKLFIESERNQAIEIANNTKKPVVCLPSDELFVFQGERVGVSDDLEKLNEGLEALKNENIQINEELEKKILEVELMKTSKFWKLRKFYMKIFK